MVVMGENRISMGDSMSAMSRKRRRAKRSERRRAFWERVGKHGAHVAPDVWESIRRQADSVELSSDPRRGGLAALAYGGVPIRVSRQLPPGMIVPIDPTFGTLRWRP